ncbi:MAG: hypothetical protein NTU73_04515 [Ignavibacteriae bacterium]|nr:hypothetical protein [Ignavibacteriota bacterium]
MITREHYLEIANKYGEFASWAVWADQGKTPKSNIGDISIFDLDNNPNLLNQLNPNVIMVGLNFSRKIEKEIFVNFHDKRQQGQDYKIRYAFKNTKFYGAYMTDIIKDFEEKISGKVTTYLKANKTFEIQNIKLFEQELFDMRSMNPLIIAFGNQSHNILNKYFRDKYKIIKVPHYSNYISKEDYKVQVERILSDME